jgi:hypothetical protein
MQDFNEFVNNGGGTGSDQPEKMDKNLFNLVNSLAARFDGKSQNDLIRAIYEEARKGKKNGTLTNREIENFGAMLSPMLDEKKRKMLSKIISELKEI